MSEICAQGQNPQCRRARAGRWWLPLLLAVGLAACTSTPRPARIEVSVQAGADVNPSVTKRPSPVLVRVYELASATAFNGADFVSMYQRDKAELGADMLAREEFMLAPGESKSYQRTTAVEARYLGVVAAFRDLERSTWRAVVPLQPGRRNKILIRADGLAVSAAEVP